MCWVAICRSPMRRCPFKFYTNVLIELLISLLLSSKCCVFWIKAFIRCVFWKYFLPGCCLCFHFFIDVIWIAKVLNFNEAQLIGIFLLWTTLLISCLRRLCITQNLQIFLCFHLKVFCFGTYTKSLIPCHLNINLRMHWLWIVFPLD